MRARALLLLLVLLILEAGCATIQPRARVRIATPSLQANTNAPVSETGYASFYSSGGRALITASGEPFVDHRLTAAHKMLPFGTRVRVTNVENGRSIVVTINDRGPFVRARVIDVTERAARDLDFLSDGLARVRLQILSANS